MADESIFDFSKVPSYDWADLYYITYELDISLDSIKEAIRYHSEVVKNKRESLQGAIKNDEYLNSNEKEEFKAQYHSHYYDHAEIAIEELEAILQNSTLLGIFSVLDGKMKYLCESCEAEIKSLIKINDLKANDNLDQYINYLTKVFGMKQDKSVPFLETIKKYKIIRNAIAHQNSKLKNNDLGRVKNLPHLRITTHSDEHTVSISSPQFLFDLIELINNYIQELVKEIDLRWKQIK